MAVDDVLAKARRRARSRRVALLHGRGVARGAATARNSNRAGDGARRARARHGSLRDARHAEGRIRRGGSPKPASPPITTISIRRPEFYGEIITTRNYDDRLDTLGMCAQPASPSAAAASSAWAKARMTARRCCRCSPSSIRIPKACRSTRWSPSQGTPLEDRAPVDPLDLVRMIAVARILMPECARASVGRAAPAEPRGASAVLLGRRQFDLLWREAADHRQ